MNSGTTDSAARDRVCPDDTIRIVGRIGTRQVDLEVRGLRDALAGASMTGLLDEYRRLSTPKQREQLAQIAYQLADTMLAVRRRKR